MTRPEPGASETAARLAAMGFLPLLAPVMTVAPSMLAAPGRAQAVLATSGNAIPSLPATLHGLPLFAVGDATAAKARAAGFATVHSAGRDAAALADLVAARLSPADGKLLLASGEGQGMALATALRARGFTVRRRVAYATRPAPSLPDLARLALAAGGVRAVLFFSPQSAHHFVTILQRDILPEVVQGIEALAISRPTEAALRGLPWLRVRVASHPNQEELLKLLQ